MEWRIYALPDGIFPQGFSFGVFCGVALKKYDKAYDFLVEQAAGHPWLHLFTVQDIVTKVGYCERLKTALYQRLGKDDLSTKQREDFTKIKDWLVFEYKQ